MSESIDNSKMPGKMTLQNLRIRQNETRGTKPSIKEQILLSLSNAFGSLSLLFAVRPKTENCTCKYYGHKIKNKNWSGAFPRCADCGIEINDPKMLRGSFVRTEEKEEDGREWRKYIDGRLVRTGGLI